MADYNPGDVARVTTVPPFKNAAGAAADPTTVRLLWRRRGHPPTIMAYPGDIIRDSVGTYHADIPIAKTGKHYVRWEGTGAVATSEELEFNVVSKF